MRRSLAAILCLTALSACSTRGTLDSACSNFNARPLPQSQLITDIQSGATRVDPRDAVRPASGPRAMEDPLVRSIERVVESGAGRDGARAGERQGSLLLLSGGGQWGAFGAGFLSGLYAQGHLPRFETITGVSTGGLQALFMGMLGDPELADQGEVLRELMRRYRPASEREIVDRHARKELSILTGSFAGLSPLRKRIHAALCDSVSTPTECLVIRRLARSKTDVFIGFVRAGDGKFYYSHINELARRAYPYPARATPPASIEALAEAQRCIAGAALASAAMPVFFQQVRIGPSSGEATYYDGGVRQSVFEAQVASLVDAAVAERARNRMAIASEPALYVIRNGPTTLSADVKADGKRNVIDGAMRAEAIVVNQLEVQSIADLRLAHPTGPIDLITADGYGTSHPNPGDDPTLSGLPHFRPAGGEEICVKDPPEAMFSPAFMACIMRYGRYLAGRDKPWIELSKLKIPERAEE